MRCVLAVIVFCGFSCVSASAETLVTVNGVPVTHSQLDFELTVRKVPEARRDQYAERYLNGLIDRELMRQFLTKRKAMPDAEQVEAAITRLRDRLEAGGEDPDALFTKIGFTDEQLRRSVALPLAWQKQVRRTLTEKQIRDYYNDHRRQLDGTRLKVRHLFLKKSDSDHQQQQLSEIRGQIVNGELTFEAAAKEYSTAPSASAGGAVGWMTYRGRLPKVVSDAAYLLEVGEVTPPVQSPFGWHLVTVEEIEPGELSLEDVRAEVVNQLADELWKTLVNDLRESAKIQPAENE